MASTKWNQDINAGEDWTASLILSYASSVARDLTGFTIDSKIKRHYKSVNTKETILVTVVDATAGSIKLSLTNTQTSNLKSGKYLYDVELTETSSGSRERVIEGNIQIRPEVTI
jgi:hypothetical protein